MYGTHTGSRVLCVRTMFLSKTTFWGSEHPRPFSLHGCHLSPRESSGPTQQIPVNWLPVCPVHSPASISQLHALSSTDKIRLLLAMVPCKGSRRFPLNNMSWVAAAAPRVKERRGQPRLLSSNSSSSGSSRSWSRTWRPSSWQDAS